PAGPHVVVGAANQPLPVGGPARRSVAAGTPGNHLHDAADALLFGCSPGPGPGERIGPGLGQVEQLPEVGRQGAAARRAGREGAPADQPLFRVESTQHGRALPEEIAVHGQADELVVVRGDVVTLLTRIDRDELARLAVPAAPAGALVARQDGSEPETAGRGR